MRYRTACVDWASPSELTNGQVDLPSQCGGVDRCNLPLTTRATWSIARCNHLRHLEVFYDGYWCNEYAHVYVVKVLCLHYYYYCCCWQWWCTTETMRELICALVNSDTLHDVEVNSVAVSSSEPTVTVYHESAFESDAFRNYVDVTRRGGADHLMRQRRVDWVRESINHHFDYQYDLCFSHYYHF